MEKVTHEGTLRIGNMDIPCYVTEEGQRLLSSRRLQVILNVTEETTSSGRQVPGKRMDRFFGQKSLKPIFNKVSDRTLLKPVRAKQKGKVIAGYDAKALPEICRIMLEGRREGLLIGTRQKKIAIQCEILQSGFAQVGIIALVDEATGYQDDRAKNALAKILEQYLAEELQKWTKTFPDEFYREMFRLKRWEWKPWTVKRPSVIGRYTIDLVYDRIAIGIRTELEQLNPKQPKGYRKSRHHQWFNPENGHPRLKEHISGIIALMRASANWGEFTRLVNRSYPKPLEDLPLFSKQNKNINQLSD